MRYLALFLFICSVATSQEKEWRIEKVGKVTTVSINGDIQFGDVLMFWMKKNNNKCDILGHTFTFYTTEKNPKIVNLKNKLIPIKIKGEKYNDGKIYANVTYLSPFLLGHRLTLSLGQYKLGQHIEYLAKHKTFDVTIIDAFENSKEQKNILQNFKVEDYFDIKNNSWSLKGLQDAILKGQQLCMKQK